MPFNPFGRSRIGFTGAVVPMAKPFVSGGNLPGGHSGNRAEKEGNKMNGKYWDKPWSLVDGCTPCSPGCDHCWSASTRNRFYRDAKPHEDWHPNVSILTDKDGRFNGEILTRYDRLDIPLKRRKPTVYSCWNDLFHESVPDDFINRAFEVMESCKQHTFLLLSKRPGRMSTVYPERRNIWHGLTVCNQPETEKIQSFLQVPGKKFLSIEPCLSKINLRFALEDGHPTKEDIEGPRGMHFLRHGTPRIDAVILGGETGPGARPCHPDWVRSVRDQCAAAGVPFFFKGWGKHFPEDGYFPPNIERRAGKEIVPYLEKLMAGKNRLLDGQEYNDLPWRTGP